MTKISEALNLREKEMVVAVGAGGKTAIINRLAGEILAAGRKVVISTTTKMFVPAGHNSLKLVLTSNLNNSYTLHETIAEMVSFYDCIVVGREINCEGKIIGLSSQEVDDIFKVKEVDFLLVEGDGAKGRPFKAPRSYEPVIPSCATVVIPVVGVECIGKPLVEKYFHAVERVAALTGLRCGETVNEQTIAEILLHKRGYKKNVPEQARWIPFINKVESGNEEEVAFRLVRILKKAGIERVVVGSAKNSIPVKEIY